MKTFTSGLSCLIAATLVAGCAGGPPSHPVTMHPSTSVKQGLCKRKVIVDPARPRVDVVLLVAVFKDGAMESYLCDEGYGSAPDKPKPTPPNNVPSHLKPGPITLLGAYQKWQDSSGDPCILLGSGGTKQYFCW